MKNIIGMDPPGIKGRLNAGKNYGNKDSSLPVKDKYGERITYEEFDVLPMESGVKNRGKLRFVRGSDNSVYYSPDHYNSFERIK